MRLQTTQPPYTQFSAELIAAPANIPGNLAIQRTDTTELIALRDVMGVPNAPGSTVKFQLLEVTPEEKTRLETEGIMLAESAEDLKRWYNNWDGPKPSQTLP